MSDTGIRKILQQNLEELKQQGLYKREREIESPQDAAIRVGGHEVINFCANNYLGLANHPEIIEAAHEGLDQYGFGMASVRFICGTQDQHRDLERKLAGFFRKEDAILYTSCFDANGGLFETLLGEEDAILSDELNHASIIDGIRLCKAKRYRYKHSDMAELEEQLKDAQSCRVRMIATDGVFSMDGDMAKLPDICTLADKYNATVMIDDCHGTGFLGASGRGTPEQLGVLDRIDIITSTLGKALGGGVGGFTVARQEVVDYLRQRSRPYLFSNALPPVVTHASMKVLEIVDKADDLRKKLMGNAQDMRQKLEKAGLTIKPGSHPIMPVMLGDASLAAKMADRLLAHGIYVIGFSFPVVPKGQARIRLQMSAAHSAEHIDRAVKAFTEVGKELQVT